MGKKYTRCYDRYASTLDLCRPSSYGRYNNRYDDRYDRNYNGRSDYYGTGVNLGRGTFRILRNGRDAELSCEFPRGSHLISNVIWERADRGRGRQSYYNDYRRSSLNLLGHRSSVRRLGDYGSILTIRDYDSSADSGVYRCTATRSYSGCSSGYRAPGRASTWRWTSGRDTRITITEETVTTTISADTTDTTDTTGIDHTTATPMPRHRRTQLLLTMPLMTKILRTRSPADNRSVT